MQRPAIFLNHAVLTFISGCVLASSFPTVVFAEVALQSRLEELFGSGVMATSSVRSQPDPVEQIRRAVARAQRWKAFDSKSLARALWKITVDNSLAQAVRADLSRDESPSGDSRQKFRTYEDVLAQYAPTSEDQDHSSQQAGLAASPAFSDVTTTSFAAPVTSPASSSEKESPSPALARTQSEDKALDLREEGVQEEFRWVEAFQTAVEVSGVRTEVLSQESRKTGVRRGWNLTLGSTAHWPTLNWTDSESHFGEEIPLLSYNTVQSLGHIARSMQEPSAGIVFGKVPSGWDIDFSGRAEKPVFFAEEDLHLESAHSSGSRNRYFVFLNAQPGAHLVYLKSQVGTSSGAVAVPIMAGIGSYLDLTEISLKELSGKVSWSSRHHHGEGNIDNVVVRVLGQDGIPALSDIDGKFKIPKALTAGAYPVFVETDRGTGYTHRYKILPTEFGNAKLYRVSPASIAKWIEQLEGGVSQTSGLVITAAPFLVEQNTNHVLIPGIRAIPSAGSLIPETYTISARSRLVPRSSLNVYENRFIGVQIPEGLTLNQIETDGGKVVWSELLITSPGVVNLVGPL